MNFYENFFDMNSQNGSMPVPAVKLLFVSRMSSFIVEEYKLHDSTAKAIASAVFDRMADKRLHYHTPVHVLAIFDFAAMHEIELEPWEELAIWFHDSVYDVNNILGDNERLSADFMYAMMRPYVKNAYDANMAIIQTGRHLSPDYSERYAKVMDLDLCGFAAPRNVFNQATKCISKEYDVELTTFNMGRKAFLEKLISKGPIYRTSAFARFEALAQENIRLDLKELNASAL